VQQALEVRHLFISDNLKMPTTEFSVGCAYLASFTCRAGTYSIMSYIFPKNILGTKNDDQGTAWTSIVDGGACAAEPG